VPIISKAHPFVKRKMKRSFEKIPKIPKDFSAFRKNARLGQKRAGL